MEVVGGIFVGLVVLFILYRAVKKGSNNGGSPPDNGGPGDPTQPK